MVYDYRIETNDCGFRVSISNGFKSTTIWFYAMEDAQEFVIRIMKEKGELNY